MIGRRAVIGLTLICALAFCAFAAPSAFANKGVTAFTCVEKGGETDFTDAHCDNQVAPKAGSFGHVAIGESTTEKVEVTNEKTKNNTTESTPAVLRSTLLTVKSELSCSKVTGSVSIKNLSGPPMSVEGKKLNLSYSGCTVLKPAKCTVKEPITVSESTTTTLVNIKGKMEEATGMAGTEMGVEVKPAGTTFTSLTYQGAECAIANGGKAYPIEGTLIGTGSRGSATTVGASGGTLIFTKEMTEKTLKFGTSASFDSTVTLKMEGGNPISYTTVEP